MEDFKARRSALLDSLGDGTALLYSGGYSSDAGHRSGSDFWYLTGLDEKGAILVLSPGAIDREVLLLPPRDIEAERWTGIRPPLSESLEVAWGFDQVYRTGYLDGHVVSRMKRDPVLHLVSRLARPSKEIPQDLEYYGKVRERIPGITVKNSSRFLETMRMIKSPAEIAMIKKAIKITYDGLTDLLTYIKPGVKEFQLDGILEQSFKKRGAQFMAFSPIVGAGEMTTILHYEKRDRTIAEGTLILLDVGAEWNHYASDVTRTLPVNGEFSVEQEKIYNIVLKAQNEAIAAIKPGITLREIDDIARNIIREEGYIDDFIHSTSHHIGLDVHDPADYWMPLAPGMVITVEPGVYLPGVEIGIRIEDDVLVTGNGHEILSTYIPREPRDVEQWLARQRD
jgi:Xaa-Pro aminopeptidase